jgi:hypothetical protein
MPSKKLTTKQREELFSAEMKLASVLRGIKNRLDRMTPAHERSGLIEACTMVWILYRLAKKEQEAE